MTRDHCKPDEPCRSVVEARVDLSHTSRAVKDHETRLRSVELLGTRVVVWGTVAGGFVALLVEAVKLGARLLSSKGF